MTSHTVVARNPAQASENRIHDDEVARAHGFRGGLVPGVTVYGYACAAMVAGLGSDFVERGSAQIRFVSPAYDGEVLSVEWAPSGELEVVSEGRTCARGEASVGPPTDVPDIAWAPPALTREPASRESFEPGTVLGAYDMRTDRVTTDAYLDAIEEPSPIYRERGWVHPGLILSCANWILAAHAVLPAWIHTASEVHHCRAVRVGEVVEVRAVVTEEYERKGRRHLALQVLWLGSGEPVAWAWHRAIWSLGPSAS